MYYVQYKKSINAVIECIGWMQSDEPWSVGFTTECSLHSVTLHQRNDKEHELEQIIAGRHQETRRI